MFDTEDTQKIMTTALAVSSVIPHTKTKNAVRAGVAISSAGIGVYTLLRTYQRRIRSRKYSYSLSISSTETAFSFIYREFEKHLRNNPDLNKRQSVVTESYYDIEDNYIQDVVFTADKEFEVEFTWGGIPIIYAISEDRPAGAQQAPRHTRTAVISCATHSEMEKVKARISEITEEALKNKSSEKNGYSVLRLQPNMDFALDTTRRHVRPLDTVIIDEEVRDRLDRHISTFINHEDEYARVAIPYHTGILLYGPPGTGKTSLVSALGAEYMLDTYIISLKMLESDADLINLSRHIRPRSIVLLEDIDTIAPNRSGSDKTKISLDALLNFLDGLSTPYGMVAVMTANNKDMLDPALVRPGRMDISAEIGYFSESMILEFCSKFVSDDEIFLDKCRKIIESSDDQIYITGADLTVPVKESMFMDTDGRQNHMIKFLTERSK